jgi:phosphatidylinositol alpha-1,6-mannosyltransferase
LGGRWPWFVLSLIGVLWALVFACDAKYVTHQVWGAFAVVAYALASLATVVLPRRWVAESVTAISVVGAVLAPLAVLTMSGRGQSEVGVVERSADLLVRHGAMYMPDPQQRLDYNPYQPGMSVFGLPYQLIRNDPATGMRGAVVTVLGDARIRFALVFVISLFASWALLRQAGPDGERRACGLLVPLALIGGPIVAIPMCAIGVDLPIIGRSCLALACAARGRSTATGVNCPRDRPTPVDRVQRRGDCGRSTSTLPARRADPVADGRAPVQFGFVSR